MKFEKIIRVVESGNKPKLEKGYKTLENLLEAISNKEIPNLVLVKINLIIVEVNSFKGSDKALFNALKIADKRIVDLIDNDLGLVKKSHYQNLWMAYGIMSGVLFSTITTQFGFDETWNSVGFGISMGLIFGMVAGKNKDTQVAKEGLQLEV
jgi:hypothetical protein